MRREAITFHITFYEDEKKFSFGSLHLVVKKNLRGKK